MPKKVYYEDNAFSFQYDIEGPIVNIHCDVQDWKPSILRKMYRVFNTFIEESKKLGIKQIISLSPNPKFAKLFGGVCVKSFVHNNVNMEVVLWELK